MMMVGTTKASGVKMKKPPALKAKKLEGVKTKKPAAFKSKNKAGAVSMKSTTKAKPKPKAKPTRILG